MLALGPLLTKVLKCAEKKVFQVFEVKSKLLKVAKTEAALNF
jgi:hypothetical protein